MLNLNTRSQLRDIVGERRMAGSERIMPLKERPDTTNTCSTEGASNYPAQLYVTLSGQTKIINRERLGLNGWRVM